MALTTCLWFNGEAEAAAKFYVDVFTGGGRNAKIGTGGRYNEASSKASGQPANSVMIITFALDGQEFMALNGGPHFKLTPAISFVVNCETQKEVDYFWQKLSEGGQESMCGWTTDKFGVSWQIVPTVLGKFMADSNRVKAEAVTAALMKMKKLDIAALQQAYEMK